MSSRLGPNSKCPDVIDLNALEFWLYLDLACCELDCNLQIHADTKENLYSPPCSSFVRSRHHHYIATSDYLSAFSLCVLFLSSQALSVHFSHLKPASNLKSQNLKSAHTGSIRHVSFAVTQEDTDFKCVSAFARGAENIALPSEWLRPLVLRAKDVNALWIKGCDAILSLWKVSDCRTPNFPRDKQLDIFSSLHFLYARATFFLKKTSIFIQTSVCVPECDERS